MRHINYSLTILTAAILAGCGGSGSSATDPGSLFVVESTAPVSSGFVVRWSSVAGHTYTLHSSTNLTEGFTVLQSGIPGHYPVNSHTTSVSGAGAYFMITTDP